MRKRLTSRKGFTFRYRYSEIKGLFASVSRMSMKSALPGFGRLAVVLCGLTSTTPSARSADLTPHEPPAPEATPAAAWSGFYAGGFAGGAWGEAPQQYLVTSTWVSANVPAIIPFADSAGSQKLGLRGSLVGLDAGYDWRVDKSFVVGLAGDLSWSNISGGRTTSGTLPVVQLPYSITERLSADWLGSLRLRAGFTPLDNLLVYVTGGPAFGHFSYSASFWDSLVPPFMPGNETESVSLTGLRAGWTLGSGVEWGLTRNWSIAGEYRHSVYDAVSGTGFLQLQQPPSAAFIGHSTGAIQVDTFRLGANYHFN